MANPVFPNIVPQQISPPWFSLDQPVDEDREIAALEQQHQAKLDAAINRMNDKLPIGKSLLEVAEEEEEEEEEEDHEDEDSESRDEADDTDMEANIPFNREQVNEIPEGINLSMELSD